MPFTSSSLRPVEVAAIARGLHTDAFAVLGPHDARVDGRDGVVVRTFRPFAAHMHVRLWPDTERHEMTRVEPEGLFEVFLAGARRATLDYRLVATWTDGSELEFDDPYRYGAVLNDFDLHLLGEGTHVRAYDRLGARVVSHGEARGVHFAVWAPNARRVSVVGDWNGWDGRVHPMRALRPSGLWEIFLPELGAGDRYKFEIVGAHGELVLKADPYGRRFEAPPLTASVVWEDPGYAWQDEGWMAERPAQGAWQARPMSIYEVHLGSWQHDQGRPLTYRELADRLVPYARDLGFTHLELMPVMEHPYTGSWGYQVTGFFAPTSRFGTPEDFKYFVDVCHQNGLGVILDWVPGHFPKDQHGLARFDGTALYEHDDPRQGEHQEWGTLVFNYGRHEVRAFLLSNAVYWLQEFHIDGLRVDAVASMLYLDYSRQEGQWVPNAYGGRENVDAIRFLQQLNAVVGAECPGAMMIAEESTSWPGVSRPAHLGGLGFTHKWNMGWMHDMLDYCAQDPVHRKWHHDRITFSMLYAFTEHFILPFSHDEVVHGKRSMLDKMPGDVWQKHATLRALYGYMFAHPGKKLLFMGGEIGQWREWHHDRGLDWGVLGDPLHAGLQRWVRDLNAVYARERALWELDADGAGFAWIDCHDHENSVISFLRRGAADPREADGGDRPLAVIVVNFTPLPRADYRVGVPRGGAYIERLNSDAEAYGGSNVGNTGRVIALDEPRHGHPHTLSLTIPPLGCLVLTPEG
jgi:1,4-alpha-glucan branching enzyme